MSFFDPIKEILSGGHTGSSVGIDIGESSIKVVELEKSNEKVVLRNYGEISLGSRAGVSSGQATVLSPEKISAALKDLFNEMGISPKHTTFTIPFKSSLLSVVELPAVSKKEIETMIPLEARRYIPVPITEVTLDWWVLPKRKTDSKPPAISLPKSISAEPLGKVEVIIAGINNETIKKYEVIKKELRISSSSSHFEIEVFITLRAVVGQDLSPIMVIDIGAGMTKFAIVEEGVVRASHVISTGGQDITLAVSKSLKVSVADAEKIKCRTGMEGEEEGRDVFAVGELILAGITNEAGRFMENYENKYKIKISKIILVGGGANLKGLIDIFLKKFPSISVALGDPFARVDAPAFLAPVIKELSPNFAAALGSALKGIEEG